MDTSPVRFTGLFSGMDTAGMVQQLMRAEAMRMDRFVRRRQTLAWRQEALRDTLTSLERFQTINTDVLTRGSIVRSDTWNAMRATINRVGDDGALRLNPPGFSVSQPTANAREGTFDIHVVRVATGDRVSGNIQFGGTAVGATGTPINVNTMYMRDFMNLGRDPADPLDWANNAVGIDGNNFVYVHERDTAGRIRFDLSSITGVTASDGTALNDNVRIARNADGDITSLWLNGRTFTAYDDGGTWVLRHTAPDGVTHTDIDRTALHDAIIAGGGFGNDDLTAPGSDQGMRYTTQNFYTHVMINNARVQLWQNDTIQQFMNRVNSATVEGLPGVSAGAHMSFNAVTGQFVLENRRISDTLDANHARIFTGVAASFDDPDHIGFLAAIGLDNIRGGSIGVPNPVFDPLNPDAPLLPVPDARFDRVQSGAVIRVNDNEGTTAYFASATNTFTGAQTGLTGMDITVSQAAVGGNFTIETGRNVENAMNAIREFVNNFNDLIRQLNALHSTPRPRAQNGNFFDPLTDAEREAMSDREIERWEEQARVGLLHRNDALRNLHQDLRSAMFQDVVIGPPGNQTRVNFSSYFMIGTSGNRSDRNIGVIDVDWERLEQSLIADPERIQAMFARSVVDARDDHTLPDGTFPSWGGGAWSLQRNSGRAPFIGLGHRIHEIIENATHADGSLRRTVGMVGMFDEGTNPMSRQIQQYDQRLQQMQRWLIRRENHFFAMFARMEQAMANANAQMDSLWMMGGM